MPYTAIINKDTFINRKKTEKILDVIDRKINILYNFSYTEYYMCHPK